MSTKKKSKPIKPPIVLRPRKKSEMKVYTQPGFQRWLMQLRKAVLEQMEKSWPRYTGTGELVFSKLMPGDVARMSGLSVQTVNKWLAGWTYRPYAETNWKIATALMIPVGILPNDIEPEKDAPIYSISSYRLAKLRLAKAITETGTPVPQERRHRKTKVLPAVAAAG